MTKQYQINKERVAKQFQNGLRATTSRFNSRFLPSHVPNLRLAMPRTESAGNISGLGVIDRVNSLMPLLLGWAPCHKTDHLSIGKRMSVLCSSKSDCHTADGIVATSRLSSAYQRRT